MSRFMEAPVGHLVGKDIFRRLGNKIDGMYVKAPWTETLHELLKELFSPEDADLMVKIPFAMSPLSRIARCLGMTEEKTYEVMERLAGKGLVMDLMVGEEMHYMPAPIAVGLFEFAMMRTGIKTKKAAHLFHEYLQEDPAFLYANFGSGQQVSYARAIPHEETVPAEYLEILEYERAGELIDRAGKYSVGLCSCRHEKLHLGHEPCSMPLESCTSFGAGADFLIRRGLARASSREEMHDLFQRSREKRVVLCADNVRKNVTFICHCCGCCCDALLGIRKHGYANAVVSSTFIVSFDNERCNGCGQCEKACPIGIIEMTGEKPHRLPRAEMSSCLGCGVCALSCPPGACTMCKRKQRVIHPETAFEKIFLQSLERGTLQNQLFADPWKLSHRFMRGVVGGFLRLPPVKRSLMSELLRSTFLKGLKSGAHVTGKGWMTNV